MRSKIRPQDGAGSPTVRLRTPSSRHWRAISCFHRIPATAGASRWETWACILSLVLTIPLRTLFILLLRRRLEMASG
eukprot:3127607-Pyramimonas_sp.AAC.1